MGAELRRGRLHLEEGDVFVLERPGKAGGGTILFAGANGLNASAYAPLLGALRTPARVIAFSARGHGGSTLPADPTLLRSWTPYADDLAVIAGAVGETAGPLVLAGHSMGAVSSLLAAAGGLGCARLVLIEPVILPTGIRLLARSPARALIGRSGIAAKAARRRAVFPHQETVAALYRDTPFFARWDARALTSYLDEGLVPDPAGVRLACDPAWEAASFAAQAHRFWRPLRSVLKAGLPVHILRTEDRSTVPPWAVPRLERAGAIVTSRGGTHVLPQEAPDTVAGWIDRMAGELQRLEHE